MNNIDIFNIFIVLVIVIIICYFAQSIRKSTSIEPSLVLYLWMVLIPLIMYLSIYYLYESKDLKIFVFLFITLLFSMIGHYTISITQVKGNDRDKYKDIYDYNKGEFYSTTYKVLYYIGCLFFLVTAFMLSLLFIPRYRYI